MTRGHPDWREQFDINSERASLWRLGAPAWMRLQGPNQWPRSLPELRPALLGWQAALTKVAVRLLRALAEALGQGPDFFEPIYRDAPNQHIKIIRYPGSDAATNGVAAMLSPSRSTMSLQVDMQSIGPRSDRKRRGSPSGSS